jgi:hypothetical protein
MDNEKDLEKTDQNPVEITFFPHELAKVFYESQIFSDIKSEAQAIVKMIAGKEIGLSPIHSMNSVYIVRNKVGYEVKIFLSKLKKSKMYDYATDFKENEKGEIESVTVSFFRVNDKEKELLGKSAFSLKDAARTGLINKQAYKDYPKLMMFYRAASDGMKIYTPDILDGNAIAEDYIEVSQNGTIAKSVKVDFENATIETSPLNQKETVI